MTPWRRLLAGALSIVAAAAGAQSTGGTYRLDPQRIASGGGLSSGGTYTLRGTIAQPEAGGVSSGGSYELTGGLHRRALAPPPLSPHVFANGFESH